MQLECHLHPSLFHLHCQCHFLNPRSKGHCCCSQPLGPLVLHYVPAPPHVHPSQPHAHPSQPHVHPSPPRHPSYPTYVFPPRWFPLPTPWIPPCLLYMGPGTRTQPPASPCRQARGQAYHMTYPPAALGQVARLWPHPPAVHGQSHRHARLSTDLRTFPALDVQYFLAPSLAASWTPPHIPSPSALRLVHNASTPLATTQLLSQFRNLTVLLLPNLQLHQEAMENYIS
jgi:hypothetical protein